MALGGMQLTKEYKDKVQQTYLTFLPWYEKMFRNQRMGYAHWQVSGRCSTDAAYHREIEQSEDGHVWIWNNTPCDQDTNGHTDGRNSNAFAIALAGEGDATTEDLGKNVSTPGQLRALVAAFVEACINNHIPVSQLMTHAEAANNVDFPAVDSPGIPAPPSYGPGSTDFERWDLHVMINLLTLEMKPLFRGATALYPPGRVPVNLARGEEFDIPAGWEYFPDWLRGQVILGIAKATESKWGNS